MSDDLDRLLAARFGLRTEDLPTRPDWHDRAACKGKPAELFFPEQGCSPAPARAICNRCEVRSECRAASVDELHGIWASTTPRQRQQTRLERTNTRCKPL